MNQDKSSFRFEMNAICYQDTLADIRNRISSAVATAHQFISQKSKISTNLSDEISIRDIYVLSQEDKLDRSFCWKLLANDFLRLSSFSDLECY